MERVDVTVPYAVKVNASFFGSWQKGAEFPTTLRAGFAGRTLIAFHDGSQYGVRSVAGLALTPVLFMSCAAVSFVYQYGGIYDHVPCLVLHLK